MTERYWFDSFPGIDLEVSHEVLDYYRTPYESWVAFNRPNTYAFDAYEDYHAPYTTVSQNRGGIA